MVVTLPIEGGTQVTLNHGSGYRVTYYTDPDDAATKVTETLMFFSKDSMAGVEGLRFVNITKSDDVLSDFWKPVAIKDIVRIVPELLGDKVVESLEMADVTLLPYDNDITQPGNLTGTPPEFHILTYN